MKIVALLSVFVLTAALGYLWKPARGGAVEAVAAAPAKNPERTKSSRIPDDVQALMATIRKAGDRPSRMRAVVELATRLPVSEFARWSRGNYLEFLDSDLEGVFHAILKERWLEEDPAGYTRFRMDIGWSGLEVGFARWMEEDMEGAIAFALEQRSKRSGEGLVAANTIWTSLSKSLLLTTVLSIPR